MFCFGENEMNLKKCFGIIGLLGAAVVVTVVVLGSGCASNQGPYFQRSDRQVHVQKDRIYNPHERHATGIDSQVSDN